MDPKSQEALGLMAEIIAYEQAQPGESDFTLGDLTPYLKLYKFQIQNPWVIPVGIGLLLVGAGSLLYWLGRRAT